MSEWTKMYKADCCGHIYDVHEVVDSFGLCHHCGHLYKSCDGLDRRQIKHSTEVGRWLPKPGFWNRMRGCKQWVKKEAEALTQRKAGE